MKKNILNIVVIVLLSLGLVSCGSKENVITVVATEKPHAEILRKAEGTFKVLKCKHTIKSWTDNFVDYLRSAMSYTGCKSLKEYIGNVDLVVNSNSEIFSVNK